MNIIIVGLSIKIILVFSQFFFILPGTEFDVLNFHNEAVRFSTHLDQNFFGFKNYDYKSGWYISNFLGLFYYFFGNYLVVGGLISCLVWFFSAIIFRKTLINLGSSLKVLDAATLFYTFIFPVTFLYTSYILREVYLLFLINLFFFSLINILIKPKTIIFNFFLLFISIILLISFHKAYYIFFIIYPLFLLLFFVYIINPLKNSKLYNFLFFLFLSSVLFVLNYLEILELFFNKIVNYQKGHFYDDTIYRADYFNRRELIDLNYNFLFFVKYLLNNIYNYFFQPTFLNVTNFKDLVLMVENLIRITFLFVIIYKLFIVFNKKIFFICFISLILMEIIYSQATINWGSASRHHVPVMGLMIFLVFFPTKNFLLKNDRDLNEK